jgi:transcriptional regulator with XRE-family HTH domain
MTEQGAAAATGRPPTATTTTEAPDETEAPLQAVGAELRRLRQKAGLSLRELGKIAQLTPGFLSLVERGESSLSLTSLFALSKALDVPAADLIQGTREDPAETEFAVWPTPAGQPADMKIGEREYWRLRAAFPGRQLEPLLMRVQPTVQPASPTSHDGEEFAYIITGTLSITLRDNEITLGPGSALHFKSEVPHSMCNHTSQPVDALWVVTAGFWQHS